jgi:hypothetical protein
MCIYCVVVKKQKLTSTELWKILCCENDSVFCSETPKVGPYTKIHIRRVYMSDSIHTCSTHVALLYTLGSSTQPQLVFILHTIENVLFLTYEKCLCFLSVLCVYNSRAMMMV